MKTNDIPTSHTALANQAHQPHSNSVVGSAVVSQCGNVVSDTATYVDTGRECCGVSYYSGGF